jgi:hypothetical protein
VNQRMSWQQRAGLDNIVHVVADADLQGAAHRVCDYLEDQGLADGTVEVQMTVRQGHHRYRRRVVATDDSGRSHWKIDVSRTDSEWVIRVPFQGLIRRMIVLAKSALSTARRLGTRPAARPRAI